MKSIKKLIAILGLTAVVSTGCIEGSGPGGEYTPSDWATLDLMSDITDELSGPKGTKTPKAFKDYYKWQKGTNLNIRDYR